MESLCYLSAVIGNILLIDCLTHSFVCSFVRSFVHSFIYSYNVASTRFLRREKYIGERIAFTANVRFASILVQDNSVLSSSKEN